MKKFTIILFLASLSFTHLIHAQELEGTWKVSGSDPEDKNYTGKLTIDPVTDQWYRLGWEFNYTNKKGVNEYVGTGYYDPKRGELVTAYAMNSPRYGLFEYELNEKGGLFGTGNWTSQLGRGAELIGGKLNRSEIEGKYEVVGRRSQGDVSMGESETYKGTLEIRKQGNLFRLFWDLGGPEIFEGFGYLINNKLVGVWGPEKFYGMKIYAFDGDTENGISKNWTSPAFDYKPGSETIEKQ